MIITQNNIQTIWDTLYPKVYGYFFRRTGNREDVEELTSKTLTKFFLKQLAKEQPPELAESYGYLWKIASHNLIDFIRSKSKYSAVINTGNYDVYEQGEFEYSRSYEYKDRLSRLYTCIEHQLEDQQKYLVTQAILEDRKMSELAEELGLKASNVRQKVHRAIKKLRDHCRKIWQD